MDKVCIEQQKFYSMCKNMLPVENDTDMEAEHYECKVCGATVKLYYEEMR